MIKNIKEKIYKYLKDSYENENHFQNSLVFLLLTLAAYVAIYVTYFGIMLEDNYLIVNTVENMANLTTPPYTYEQSVELGTKINTATQPLIYFLYFVLVSAIISAIIGVCKHIQEKRKNV